MTDAPSTASAEAITARFSETLYLLLRERGRVFVLLDRWNGFLLQAAIDEAGLASRHQSPLRDPVFADAPQRAPLLLELDRSHGALLDEMVALAVREALDVDANSRHVCGFLFADADEVLDELAARLSIRLQATLAQPRRDVYLDYIDPRVLPRLQTILTADQLRDLLGSVTLWLLPARDGSVHRVEPPARTADSPLIPDFRPRLNAPQSAALERLDPLNRAVRLLRQRNINPSSAHDAQLDALIRTAATELKLSKPDDQAAYAAAAFLHGPALAQHPLIAPCIGRARQGVPLADSFDAVDEKTWAAIRAGTSGTARPQQPRSPSS